MKINIASNVILLLAAFQYSYAVKDKKTGKLVIEFSPVINALVKSTTFDKNYLGNSIPSGYDLSLNEKWCLSKLVSHPYCAESLERMLFLRALEEAKALDDDEKPLLDRKGIDPEAFYGKVLAFHFLSDHFKEIKIILKAKLLDRIALVYELSKFASDKILSFLLVAKETLFPSKID